MAVIEFGRRRLVFLLAAIASLYVFYEVFILAGHGDYSKDTGVHVPGIGADKGDDFETPGPESPSPHVSDAHPITTLMEEADRKWRFYEGSRSTSFKQVVEKYRSKHGRHPPPGFKEWYKFAKDKNVWNIDDFDQIMDDLRPFWAIDARTLRTYAAHMWENPEHGVATIHIRNHKILPVHNHMWRTDVMESCISKFLKHLPDMDIPMNRLDQPRVVVPWDDLQELLGKEYDTRAMPPETMDEFTAEQDALLRMDLKEGEVDDTERLDAGWFNAPGRQYMEIASKACPPDSPARNPGQSIADADKLYKEPLGGLVTNFNTSSDLCTVGPAIQDLHGMLYSASSIIASHKLVPIFGECKVNVNNDILFPANMYYKHDNRYDYDDKEDLPWKEKDSRVVWRGVTSGGVQIAENWQSMHRQRLVQLLNGTFMSDEGKTVDILSKSGTSEQQALYEKHPSFSPSTFATQIADVGFVKPMSCIPDCSFYDNVFTWLDEIPMAHHFRSKYLIDVDGHSFSGRWHAFLQSKSLGFKATIFREWHDSRLFAWRHFVPLDNRYDDLYSLLTYFVGYRDQSAGVDVPEHQAEAMKIARQGREWANKVLRRDDIEVYTFRLLLEYGRLIDDNRDRIGYSGDGSELDKYDNGEENLGSRLGIDKLWKGFGKKPEKPAHFTGDPEGEGVGDRLGFGKAPPAPPASVGSDG